MTEKRTTTDPAEAVHLVKRRHNFRKWRHRNRNKVKPRSWAIRPKDEIFCQEYVRTGSVQLAGAAAGLNPTTAGKKLNEVNVQKRVKSLMEQTEKRARIDAETILQRFEEIAEEARDEKQYNAALKGYELCAKHLGMFTERKDVHAHIDVSNMSEEQINNELESLLSNFLLGQESEETDNSGEEDDPQQQ
jgi:hypothetical protein